jgi:hypothetical protein
MDAAGHIRPDFFPYFINQTDLVAWLETGGDVALTAEYEKGAPCPSSRPAAAGCLAPAGCNLVAGHPSSLQDSGLPRGR